MIRAANETDARTGAAVRDENRRARRIERSIPGLRSRSDSGGVRAGPSLGVDSRASRGGRRPRWVGSPAGTGRPARATRRPGPGRLPALRCRARDRAQSTWSAMGTRSRYRFGPRCP